MADTIPTWQERFDGFRETFRPLLESIPITRRDIRAARRMGACPESLAWAAAEPRTYWDLFTHNANEAWCAVSGGFWLHWLFCRPNELEDNGFSPYVVDAARIWRCMTDCDGGALLSRSTVI